ncbi:mitotic-spindle organizing gamma-tubulin ring associated-domain-containing protein [Syncephalis plumigaleata]|nr:mitotic-spindle organizing gamma-tubulin ring associated-domain-containing protein [Syncephalis plumigaleata]
MTAREEKADEAREVLRVLHEISTLLNTGQLGLCVKMCERGVNPEALAAVIKELRREAAAIRTNDTAAQHGRS